jgi:serine/threonine-protein kinase
MAELTQLGRYKLVRVLGRGAMGVVYEGLDPSLNRRVAVKTILRNAAIDEETAQAYSAQFAREAQAAGRLNHPNIVQVHDYSEEGEVAYLVMEYIQGRELRSYFEAKERFETPEAVRVMGELLDALHFAHEAGVIHRDVKPANVMLDAQRRVKLADFGVARIQDSERSAAGTMVGTPAFMSPEQIQGGRIDRRTDIFSAGVVLYQLLTGEQPFTGAGAWTVAKKIMQDDPPRPSAVVKSISPAFDEVVHKALAKNPAQRYASARDFALALRAAEGGAAQPPATASMPPPAVPRQGAKATEAEVEFWRAIQNSSDAAEFEFYLEQFPDGTYAPLARHKIAKLQAPAEAARKEAEEQARAAAEAQARAQAEADALAKAEAEARARAEAEARARKAAEEQARQEAEAKRRREAVEAEARARREAEAQAKRAAAEKARREAVERERQAAALARLQQQEAAARAASTQHRQHDPEATIAIGHAAAPPAQPARAAAASSPAPASAPKKSFVLPAIAGAVVVVVGVAAFFLTSRTSAPPPPSPVAEAPSKPAAPAAPAVDEEKIRREVEERLRREFAEKAAAEKAANEKLAAARTAVEKEAAEKAAQKATAERVAAENASAGKAAADKAAAAKASADKAAAEKAAQEKLAADKAAAEKAAAEKLAAEKAAADKAAAEKAAADRLAAEKAAAEKAAKAVPARPGVPAVGDRWVYEAREVARPEKRHEIVVEALAVAPNAIRDVARGGGGQMEHKPGAYIYGGGPGIGHFSPYLRAFQELKEGQRWSNIEFQRFGNCSSNPQVSCSIDAQVGGREKVTVKAGSFDATKVLVESNLSGSGFSSAVLFTFWFAEDARRFVKMQSRIIRGRGGSFPEMDVELLSYTPAGGR